MAYTCKRCGYEAKDKFNLRRHLMKANPCKAITADISPSSEDLLSELDSGNNVKIPMYACSACNKEYVHKSGLSRHKTICLPLNKKRWKEEQEDKDNKTYINLTVISLPFPV